MKSLHRSDLYCWSSFDTERNVDFNSYVWVRPDGNVVIDPMPISHHDLAHLNSLGTVAWIVITNSDHIRAATDLANITGAKIAAPFAEKETFTIKCELTSQRLLYRTLTEGEELVPGLKVFEMQGSKTPGELALLLEGTTLITGDLIRAHQAGSLMILPDAKLQNRSLAVDSVKRLAAINTIEAVLVGDGWSVFRDGSNLLQELASKL